MRRHKLRIRRGTLKQKPRQCQLVCVCVCVARISLHSASVYAPFPPTPTIAAVFGFLPFTSSLFYFQLVVCFLPFAACRLLSVVCCNLMRHCLPHAFFIVSNDTLLARVSAEISALPPSCHSSPASATGLAIAVQFCCNLCAYCFFISSQRSKHCVEAGRRGRGAQGSAGRAVIS